MACKNCHFVWSVYNHEQQKTIGNSRVANGKVHMSGTGMMHRNNVYFYFSFFGCMAAVAVVTVAQFFGLHLTHSDCSISEPHLSEVDLEFGKHTKEEIDFFHNLKPKPGAGTLTLPIEADGLHENDVLTIVVDFKDSSQPVTQDIFGNNVGVFEIDEYGFVEQDFETIVDAIMVEVRDDYFNELSGTVANENGQDLQINFIEGDIGTAPPGISEFYFVQVGTGISGPVVGALGVAGGSAVRNSAGSGPNFGVPIGSVVASVFTNNIQNIGNLSPSNALSSGNLTFTRNAVVGTLSHEIGHALSLSHINVSNSIQPTGAAPIMGTGAIDLPNQSRLTDREFSLSGMNAQAGNGAVFQVSQLVGAIGLDDVFDGTVNNTAFNLSAGITKGGLTEIDQDDSNFLKILAGAQSATPIQFEVIADSPLLNPPHLILTIDTRTNSSNLQQQVEVFNFSTGTFDVVDQSMIGFDFQSIELELGETPSDYVNVANCQVFCRVSYASVGPVLFFPWAVEVDQVQFEIRE